MPEFPLAAIAAALQLGIGTGTLLYLVFVLGPRIAVMEFQVDQLWRWATNDRQHRKGAVDADRERG